MNLFLDYQKKNNYKLKKIGKKKYNKIPSKYKKY